MPLQLTPNQPPYYTQISEGGAKNRYVALITQDGTTAPPTAIILYNTYNNPITWTRSSQGNYTGTLTGAFTDNKTTAILGSVNAGSTNSIQRQSNDAIGITTQLSGVAEDGILSDTTVIIETYN